MQMYEVDQNLAEALTKLLIVRVQARGRNSTPRESMDSPWLPVTLNVKGWAINTNGMGVESRKGPDADGYSHSSFPL